jgi:hypothetical protein
MLARPNRRSAPDPNRAPYEIIGVFHETFKPVGDGRRNADGMSDTGIASSVCTFSAPRDCFAILPTQGDEVLLCEHGRTFRVMDVQIEMKTRTRLVLEATEAITAA